MIIRWLNLLIGPLPDNVLLPKFSGREAERAAANDHFPEREFFVCAVGGNRCGRVLVEGDRCRGTEAWEASVGACYDGPERDGIAREFSEPFEERSEAKSDNRIRWLKAELGFHWKACYCKEPGESFLFAVWTYNGAPIHNYDSVYIRSQQLGLTSFFHGSRAGRCRPMPSLCQGVESGAIFHGMCQGADPKLRRVQEAGNNVEYLLIGQRVDPWRKATRGTKHKDSTGMKGDKPFYRKPRLRHQGL